MAGYADAENVGYVLYAGLYVAGKQIQPYVARQRNADVRVKMTEKQYDLTERMEEEYAEYLEDLLKTDKQTIISMSDKTAFYADMLTYVKENDLLSIQVQALSAADRPLKAMYECFMENDGDLLRRADTAVRVLYQTAKDWKNQNQM